MSNPRKTGIGFSYGSGSGGGLVYPDSAARPFGSNSARNNWANNNKNDLIKDTTAVNVNGNQWWLWSGESNPQSVNSSLWMEADLIISGEKGNTGDRGPSGIDGLTVTNAVIDGAGELIVTLSDGSTINAGVAKGADGTDGTNGTDGTDGSDGSDGLTVTNAEINNTGNLIITLSDGSELDAGFVGGVDPRDGFELNTGNRVGMNSDGAITARDSNGVERDAVSVGIDVILIGSPDMALQLRTSEERISVSNNGASNQLAYVSDIPTSGGLGSFLIDDDESSHLRTGSGITSTFNLATGEHTLTVDPTNIDLSDYAELEKDAVFTKISVKNLTNPLFESIWNVTNGGNTEVDLVGTSNFRKVDKATGTKLDVFSINGTSGAMDLKTDVTYQGAITNDKSPITKEYLEVFGRGIGVPNYTLVSGGNTYQQASHIGAYQNTGTSINDVVIELDTDLLEAEVIISMPSDGSVTTKNFDVVQVTGQGTSKNIRSGDTWRVRMILDQTSTNRWFWEKIYTGGGNTVYGVSGRNDNIEDVSVKAFAYAEGMPYHLLLETPTSSRLFHEFPRNKTFVFSPNATARSYVADVVINESNQGVPTADLSLGEYSDFPLYIMEPNVVINRDQRASINFPANMTIDVSNGFYCFGTVSGWCGNSQSEGNVGVYVGTSDNFRSYSGCIGFVLGNSGIFIVDGQNLRTANNSSAISFNIEPGITHMIRYAFYVDLSGLMTYYIYDLNTGQVSTGTQQCTLGSIGNNPKMYISYDRYGNSTAAIAIAETHLVLNSSGTSEGRWGWRF